MLNNILLSIATLLIFSFISFLKKLSKRQNLQGKVALVTGGSNGLGQQICIKLAQKGCSVIIADILPAQEILKSLEVYKVKSKAFKVDVSNFNEVLKLKENLLDEFGTVDILVNNAGLIAYKTIFEQSSDEIERLTKVNINSVIFMTKCFLSQMIKQHCGHIVFISSLQGIYAFPYSINYAATKFAVTGFMLSLKEFLRREKLMNINTSCILPHVISTRDDITSIMNSNVSDLLTPEKCAEIVVDAIINKKTFVTIPTYHRILVPIFNTLPYFLQHFIRDYFQREHLFLKDVKV